MDELGLHPVLHRCFGVDRSDRGGLGVWPETRYPDDWHRRKKSQGLRCDIVLTPGGVPLRDAAARGTLFADTTPACDPDAAYWLEVKTVAQFEPEGPFRRYASELLSPVTADVTKLWRDGVIRHAGLLIVLFTADQTTAEHDLDAWYRRCLERGLPVGAPSLRGLPISDRIGNGWCGIGLYPVRG